MPQHLMALLPAALLCTGLAQAGTAVVAYDQPEHFTDIGPTREAGSVLQAISNHLDALATTRLPIGQTLRVTITDIDLAGEISPTAQRWPDVRVLGRHPDWPRIRLRYSLQDGARVLAEGSETLSDMAYLTGSAVVQGRGPLPYEQRMLSDWFDRRFTTPAAPTAPTPAKTTTDIGPSGQ